MALVASLLAGAAASGVAGAAELGEPAASLAPSAKERRAVRGRAIPEVMEPPELTWLRQFARSLPAEASEALAERELPEWTRSLQVPELDIPWSRTLLRLVQHMKEDRRGREAAAGLLRRFGRHRATVEAALVGTGAPRALAYAALARSGFEPQATDADGAAGFWMVRVADARELGVQVSFWLDARRDPDASTQAVGRHLSELQGHLGSWQRALAAFHEGDREPPARTLQVVGELGEDAAAEDVAGTPGGRFVAFTFAVAVVGENREALGFTNEGSLEGLSFDEAESPGGVTLATLASAARCGVEMMRALNPALLRERTPPGEERIVVRVPRGTGSGFPRALAAVLSPLDRLPVHRLRWGESLDDLAMARGVSPRELRRLNGVRDASELRPRTALVVPPRSGAGAPVMAAEQSPEAADFGAPDPVDPAASEPAELAAEEPTSMDGVHVVGVPTGAAAVEGRVRVFYRTTEGDTVTELAQVFGVTPEEIIGWNSLDVLARLQPRMVLQLHVPPELPREEVLLVPASRVKVAALGSEEFHVLEVSRRGKSRTQITAKSGDTLVKIARRYGVSPGDLARVNRYGWSNELPEGHRVIMYSSSGQAPRHLLGRSQGSRRPLPPPVPKATAVGKSRQERGAQAARPPQTPPLSKVTRTTPGRRTAVPPKTAVPAAPGRRR